jgi:hypothetical protein
VGSLRLLHSESGETLGPSGPSSSAVSMVLPFLKVLLGSRRSRVLGEWWEKSEGTAVAGLHRFVHSSLSSFIFFWHAFVVAPAFLCFKLLYDGCLC